MENQFCPEDTHIGKKEFLAVNQSFNSDFIFLLSLIKKNGQMTQMIGKKKKRFWLIQTLPSVSPLQNSDNSKPDLIAKHSSRNAIHLMFYIIPEITPLHA